MGPAGTKIWLPIGLGALIITGATVFFGWVPQIVERSHNRILPYDPYQVFAPARKFHDTLTIADLHSDSLLWNRDLLDKSQYGHVDVPRLIEGNVALQVFSAVTKIPRDRNYDANTDESDTITLLTIAQLWPVSTWTSLTERALHQADKLYGFAERAPGRFQVVRTAPDLRTVLEGRKKGQPVVAGVLAIEGAHALEGDLANVKVLYDAGYRMIGLHHYFDNELGGSMHGLDKGGLTEFGRNVVRKAEELNIVVDLAHSSAQVVDDVLDMATRPVVVSHTGVQGTCEHVRNLTDNQIRRIAEGGGLIGIGYWAAAVCDPSPESIVSAMRYTADLAGVEHVALGSDYDGSTMVPFDTSELAILTQQLMQVGFSDEDVRKMMGQNTIDFLLKYLPQE